MKLTEKSIKTIAPIPPKTDVIEFDDEVPGFGVRARAGGSKVFIVQYAIGDKQRRMSLGKTALQTVDTARESAKDILAAVRLGKDPAGEKLRDRSLATETVGVLAERFLQFQEKHGGPNGQGLRPKSLADLRRHLMVHAKSLHGLLVGKVHRQDIGTVLSALRGKGAAVTANRVRTSLSSFFSWLISEGLTEINPVMGTRSTEERSRERVLSYDELRIIWNALEDDHYGAILKLLMLLGQRANEIAGLARSELTEYGFTLPPERAKNHREHAVPLSAVARAIIDAQPIRQGADGAVRDLIFGTREGPFSGWSKSRKALDDRIRKTAGKQLDPWVPHDLRRSFATHAAGIGIQPHVIEAVLNHVSGFKAGVAGVYNRNPYEAEKAAAIDAWSMHLLLKVQA
jgi:integrase